MNTQMAKNESKCTACTAVIFACFTANIFAIICGARISCKASSSPQECSKSHGSITCMYILSMTYYIVVILIQFSVLLIVLNGHLEGLLGMIIPITAFSMVGLWLLKSAFQSFTKIYLEQVIAESNNELLKRREPETQKVNMVLKVPQGRKAARSIYHTSTVLPKIIY